MDFAGNMDVADLSFSGNDELQVDLPDLGQLAVPVNAGNGGTVGSPGVSEDMVPAGSPEVLTFGRKNGRNEIEPKRFFAPYWLSRLD